MKLNFNWANDGQVHTYCVACHGENVDRRKVRGKTQYYCRDCDKMYDRWIKIDPGITWWIASDGEYWHESSGVFIRSAAGKFFFFQQDIFPFRLTVPAGHVDKGEAPMTAANRELEEEVGLTGRLHGIADEEIMGDSCSRGSDAHVWHAFLLKTESPPSIHVKEEGNSPVWLTLEEALHYELTRPVRYIIKRYNEQLSRLGRG